MILLVAEGVGWSELICKIDDLHYRSTFVHCVWLALGSLSIFAILFRQRLRANVLSTPKDTFVGAVLAFQLTGSVSLVAHVNERDRQKREAHLTEARRVSEAGSGFRGAILMMEATCESPNSADCARNLDTLRDSYYRYAFEAPAVMWQFRAICAPDRQTGICNLARRYNFERMVDALNVTFREYLNALADCDDSPERCTAKRRTLARRLYENGRILQCAVAEVIYNIALFGERMEFTTYASCEDPHWDGPVYSGTCALDSGKELEWDRWRLQNRPALKHAAPNTATGRSSP